MNGQLQQILARLRRIGLPSLIPERQIAASTQRIHRFQRVVGPGAASRGVEGFGFIFMDWPEYRFRRFGLRKR